MKQYIDGELVNGAGDLMHVYNPATGQEEASFSGASPAQALEALQAAQRAFAEWSALSIAQRERPILRLADAIESYQSEVVDTLIAETGKPMATALYDFGMLVDCLRYFNEEMKRMHGQIISDYDNSHTNLILRKPIGVVAAYLYTHNLERAMEVAQGMRFGSVCVNEPFYAFNLPHGGVKESGVGKDCSHFSLEEYLEVRRISIRH